MSTIQQKPTIQKPVVWVSALMTRFEEQLPCRIGPQTHHTRVNVQQNRESLIQISSGKFSLVISGLTKTLTKINEMRPTQVSFYVIAINICDANSLFFV